MANFTYAYVKEINVDRLRSEIVAANLSSDLTYITTQGLNVVIAFSTELSTGDKTSLDTIVANHVAVDLTESLEVSEQLTGILVPLYVYPSNIYTNSVYNELIDLKKKYPAIPVHVILNPSSGPGTATDGNYSVAIKRLHGANIHVLGYIATNYTTTTLSVAKETVAKWNALYPEIDGIFIDEMTSDDDLDHISYYQELTEYIHNYGYDISIGNPGLAPNYKYFTQRAADVIVTHENSSWPSEATLKGDFENGNASFTPNSRSVIVHSQSSFDEVNFEMAVKYVRYLYVQDAANYNTISPYIERMLRELSWVQQHKNKAGEAIIKGWTSYEDGFTRVSDSSFTVSGDSYDEIFVPGRPLRYKDTSGSTWYYGIVESVSGSTVNLAGAPLQTSIDDLLEVAPFEKVVVKTWKLNGSFATAWNATLLASNEERYERWRNSEAALVQVCHRADTADSGANQPRANIRIEGNPICTANSYNGMDVNTSWQDSGVDIATGDYSISYGEDIEISTDANGTNNDASDLTVQGVFVLK